MFLANYESCSRVDVTAPSRCMQFRKLFNFEPVKIKKHKKIRVIKMYIVNMDFGDSGLEAEPPASFVQYPLA